ncbi:uncharacterized protein B0T15DRAFT_402399 [Chaetomium strumarium]|uniref:Uncharacterized protein n=1 Tax=Chaetomium strumarium TaxID=1170767 RepID=A0AAJ0GN97_9PEZI|nr:hypothetical protein B0T15DRAFT_402399 [Chaetomium strumarium]
MGSHDSIPKSPTRIPRPTFMATSPRTPSIRAVPYSHTARTAPASRASGRYSPSSWPFPKSEESSSLELPLAPAPHHKAQGVNDDMKRTASMRSSHRATASAASSLTATGGIIQAARDETSRGHVRAEASFHSVETQIYAPKPDESGMSAECSRLSHAKGPLLQPTDGVPERPMTPTPYSVLRKISEASHLETGEEAAKAEDDQHSMPQAEENQENVNMKLAGLSPEESVTGDRPDKDTGGLRTASRVEAALNSPVLRDEEGRVLSRVHPPFRTNGSSNGTGPGLDTNDDSTCSAQAEYGGSDIGTATGASQGIILLGPAEDTKAAAGVGKSARNNSAHSRRPMTVHGEIPDIESLRRGPRIRHSRLPPSPSMAANAGWSIPRGTKELWGVLGRLRKMMLASAILLELCILNLVSSVTAVIVTHIEQGYAGIGLVAWAAVSGVLVLTFAGLLGIGFLQHQKTRKDLVSGENWIEMHLRSRPLPPRPQSEQRNQDSGATEAWQKFVRDHEQLRRYVEFLESRIGVLEEGRQTADQQNNGSEADPTGTRDSAASNINNENNMCPSSQPHNDQDALKEATVLRGSSSRRQLLQSEGSVPESKSWGDCSNKGVIPSSDTKTSILTELCEAVTQGYSPLSEQMRGGSSPFSHNSNNDTPSARPRGSTLRPFALPSKTVIY